MTIEKLVAGQKGSVLNSTGGQIRDTVNALVDANARIGAYYQTYGCVKIGGGAALVLVLQIELLPQPLFLGQNPQELDYIF